MTSVLGQNKQKKSSKNSPIPVQNHLLSIKVKCGYFGNSPVRAASAVCRDEVGGLRFVRGGSEVR